MKRGFVLSLFCVSIGMIAAAEPPAPEAGERELSAEESEKTLRAMGEAFKAHPYVRAIIKAEVEDLAGKRVEEGELLLERPARMLRKFTKPAAKAWLLDGAQISEYAPTQKTIFVKDFSNAPKALARIQAAMTGDIKALEPLFAMHIFLKPGGEGKSSLLRVVLDKKTGASRRLHKRIQARIVEGGLFFDEIHYVPDEGDEVTERFSEIKEIAKPSDADFALPNEWIERKVEKIEEN